LDQTLKRCVIWDRSSESKIFTILNLINQFMFSVRERRANQMRNMMRIGRRSDPLMARVQPNMRDYQNNEIDYSHLFRPNGFF
jgi:hypothetical protein